MKFLIAYDITNNKNRKKVSDILEGIGYRVNLSVFECELNESKLKILLARIDNLVDKNTDSLRFYRICENCISKSFEICNKPEIFEQKDLFI